VRDNRADLPSFLHPSAASGHSLQPLSAFVFSFRRDGAPTFFATRRDAPDRPNPRRRRSAEVVRTNPLSHSLIFRLDVDTPAKSLRIPRVYSAWIRRDAGRHLDATIFSRRVPPAAVTRMLTESSARIPDNGEFISCFTPPRSPAILYRPLHPASSYPSSRLRVCLRNIYNRDKRSRRERARKMLDATGT